MTAFSGQEGLEKVKGYTPDLIILDLLMPIIDGYEVCQKLKEDPRTSFIPVVIITAMGQEAAQKAISMGAEDYLLKPVETKDLIAMIERYV